MANPAHEITAETKPTAAAEYSCGACFKRKNVCLTVEDQNLCIRFGGSAREQKRNFGLFCFVLLLLSYSCYTG
jgi:hypothetical protein